jgi:hypothetical protein
MSATLGCVVRHPFALLWKWLVGVDHFLAKRITSGSIFGQLAGLIA